MAVLCRSVLVSPFGTPIDIGIGFQLCVSESVFAKSETAFIENVELKTDPYKKETTNYGDADLRVSLIRRNHLAIH